MGRYPLLKIPTIADPAHVSDVIYILHFIQATKPIISSRIIHFKVNQTNNIVARVLEDSRFCIQDSYFWAGTPTFLQNLLNSPFGTPTFSETDLWDSCFEMPSEKPGCTRCFYVYLNISVEQTKFQYYRGSISNRNLTITLSIDIYDSGLCKVIHPSSDLHVF